MKNNIPKDKILSGKALTRGLMLGTHKRCTRCSKIKPLASFPPTQLTGYNTYLKCKDCIAVYTEAARQKLAEQREKEHQAHVQQITRNMDAPLTPFQLSLLTNSPELFHDLYHNKHSFASHLRNASPGLYKKLYGKENRIAD